MTRPDLTDLLALSPRLARVHALCLHTAAVAVEAAGKDSVRFAVASARCARLDAQRDRLVAVARAKREARS